MLSVPSSRLLLSALLAALASTACSKEPAANAATTATGVSAEAPAGDADAAASADATAAPATVRTVTGTVVETMNAASYTYVRVDTGTEKIWAATSQMEVAVGDRLVVPLEMSMRNFHSDTLDRDFPLLYFSSSVSREGEAPAGRPAAAGQATPPGHPPVGGGAAKAPVTVTEVIPPPPGGRSVADLWAQRASLAGQTVVVRGKVVKFLGGIMGRNWVHLQDGTGSAKDGTNDITVTTDADVNAGDIVTVTGTLAVDKDFGSGYRYGALIEGATIGR
jgi:hypothetical protein